MTGALAAVAAAIGIILIAGSNGPLALGLGLLALAAYLVVSGMLERLERIERTVEDVRMHAEAERLNADLARRPPAAPGPSDASSSLKDLNR